MTGGAGPVGGTELDPPPDNPLTTKEGWSRWARHTTVVPELRSNWPDLAAHERAEDEQERLDYHSELVVVSTPTIQQITKTVRRLLILNRHQISARRGLIVTGGAGTGKTTAVTQLGRIHELGTNKRNPVVGSRIPVVYITLPPAATARMVAVEFARFLGLPVAGRANLTDITNSVCAVLCDVRCELVIVDEIHNISLTTRSGAEVSDQLKYFSERIPATFVYAGLEVEAAGLFTGIRGRQIASRFAAIETTPFAYGTAQQREHWRAVVVTMEQAVRLHRHTPGALARHGEYLYKRTDGMLGSLSALIRGAAIDAILDGTEKITKAHLEAQLLDRAATDFASLPTGRTKRARKRPDVA